jgi:hypothetical protein
MGSHSSKPAAGVIAPTSSASSSSSTTTTKGNSLCEDCNRRVDEEAVATAVVPALRECEDLYNAVDQCMKQHLGRVAPCAAQWDEFRLCHLRQKEQQQQQQQAEEQPPAASAAAAAAARKQ